MTLLLEIASLRAEISGLKLDLIETDYGTAEHRMLSDLIADKQTELLNLTEKAANLQSPAEKVKQYHRNKPGNQHSIL